MAIRLEKGQRINLTKNNGTRLTQFCVGCNWGAVIQKTFFGLGRKAVDVDLDLSCMMFDSQGKAVDHIWSPLFRFAERNPQLGLPNGKLSSNDSALRHTGDDLKGDLNGNDELDNEVITVDLTRVSPYVNSIIFFLNIYNNNEYQGDFSGIPYAYIRMYEPRSMHNGVPVGVKEVFAQYDVSTATQCAGKRALVMGRLYRRNGEWRFGAVGDAFEDPSIVNTIARVMQEYNL